MILNKFNKNVLSIPKVFTLCPYSDKATGSKELKPTSTIPANVKVFDRYSKLLQRNRAAQATNYEDYLYVRNEIAARTADRIFDIVGRHDVCLDLGCGYGHIAPHLIKENVQVLIQCDMSLEMIKKSRGAPQEEQAYLNHYEELAPFRKESIDLIVSSMSAHWINDLPTWFRRCLEILKPDGCMIGTLLSGETLHELRVALQLAEMERFGGLGQHISPFVESQDVASLMNRAGFGMITLDIDEIQIGYPDIFALMYDLKGMGESNANQKRSGNLRRETLIAANAIYKSFYGKENRYPATFQFINFIGWRPGPKMPKPAKRGSQDVSFKDISKIIENRSDLKEYKKNSY